jgi:hypothetical protein
MIKGILFTIKISILLPLVSGSLFAQVNTFTVTVTGPGTGAGTLQWAINQANATPNLAGGNDEIVFAPAITTILLAADLTSPTEPVTINASNGTTTPTVVLNGNIRGFLINNAGAAGTIIKGFAFYSCTGDAIEINGVSNITVQNCWFGLKLDGTAYGNPASNKIASDGIFINNSTNITIGGTTSAARNIISACGANGINIAGSSTNCTILGNYIGTSVDGLTAIPNITNGIYINASSLITIGGSTSAARNVISGNSVSGILLDNADDNIISNNYVGTNSTGNVALGNSLDGIRITTGATGNDILNNVVSANTVVGIHALDLSSGSDIYGNIIGLGADGTTALGNGEHGIRLVNGSGFTNIGGTGVGQRNYIAKSTYHGIIIDDNSSNCVIKNNYIGSDITGLLARGNTDSGIIPKNSNNTVIGGSGANEGNLICCSTSEHGVRIEICDNTTVLGNLIGVNKNGNSSAGFGNFLGGVYIFNFDAATTANNVIGGVAVGQANIISYNTGHGVNVISTAGTANSNSIIGNKINCNGGEGIFLEGGANQGILAPGITTSGPNTISGTGINGNTIHVYRNVTAGGAACNCEGEIYLGTTTVVGTTWSFSHNLGLSAASALSVTATQTNASNSTSQFTTCSSPPLPVTLINFFVSRKDEKVAVSWATSSETNNDYFTVERSSDGKTFEQVGNVSGVGNSLEQNKYSIEDASPIHGTSYYRLVQVDHDQTKTYSEIKTINIFQDSFLQIYPNPSTGIFVMTMNSESEFVDVLVQNLIGQELYSFSDSKSSGEFNKTIDLSALPNGIYYMSILTGELLRMEKIIKE